MRRGLWLGVGGWGLGVGVGARARARARVRVRVGVGGGAVGPRVRSRRVLPRELLARCQPTEAGHPAVQQLRQRDTLDAIVVEERRADEVSAAAGEAAEPLRLVEAEAAAELQRAHPAAGPVRVPVDEPPEHQQRNLG